MQNYFLLFNLSLLCACSDSKDEEVDTDDTEDMNLDCVETDLGTAIGDAVATGDASIADNTYVECGEIGVDVVTDTADPDFEYDAEGMGNDIVLSWTAPDTMTYTIQTIGSADADEDTDTMLTVFESAECVDGIVQGQLVGCNDDFIGLDSAVTVEAVAGATYIIILDMYDDMSNGDWVLNITEGEMEPETDWDTGMDMTEEETIEESRLTDKAMRKHAAKKKQSRSLVRKQSIWGFLKQSFEDCIRSLGW